MAIVLGPDEYTVSDDPGTRPQAVIRPGGRCETPDETGKSLDFRYEFGETVIG